MPETTSLRTGLGRTWKIKTLLFTLGLLVLGVWGAYDAFLAYPARGRLHEQFTLREYLREAEANLSIGSASVEDPAAELRRLRSAGQPSQLEQLRREWLTSVSRIKSLGAITRENEAELARRAADPTAQRQNTPTLFANPRERLAELNTLLANQPQPKGLHGYDLPMQYAFMIGGFSGALWLLSLFVRVSSRVYRYDPESFTLTPPDVPAFTPADIELVDKRKWDKFLVFLRLRDRSDELRLDLYRHDPLEAWVLEMEQLAPGYEPVSSPGEARLCVDLETGRLVNVVQDAERPFPAADGRYLPALRSVSGRWFVVGDSPRASLGQALDAGRASAVSVRDRDRSEIDPGEVDEASIETISLDASPAGAEESAAAASE